MPDAIDTLGEAIAEAAWSHLSVRLARLEEADLTVAQVGKRLRKRDSFVVAEILAGRLRAFPTERDDARPRDWRIAPRWVSEWEDARAAEYEAQRCGKLRRAV